MKILVTGGAGYIGSHTCVELLNRMNHAIQTEDSQAVNEMICSYERINEMTEQLFELK